MRWGGVGEVWGRGMIVVQVYTIVLIHQQGISEAQWRCEDSHMSTKYFPTSVRGGYTKVQCQHEEVVCGYTLADAKRWIAGQDL
ncbi:hypothetical protein BD779DRAFT_1488999, partial [Infundibulicybe gibba]